MFGNMQKKREERNIYDLNALLGESLRITKYDRMNQQDLYKVLREVAMRSTPAEFRYNHLLIHYNVKDEWENFKLHWIVTNRLSGRQKIFNTVDYVGKTGRILWKKLGGEMNKV